MVNQLGHVSSPEFWPAATNSAAAIVVLVVSATKWNVATTGVKLRTTRGSWRSQLGSGWPESTAASSAAAAGVRSCTGVVLELEVEQSEALGMLYGFLRTCWTRRGDQMVTGVRRRRARRRRRFGRGGEEATVMERGEREGETVA